MASTSILRPGTEIIGLDGAKYPSAYSSFAISVDSRAAETSQTPDILHEKPSGRPVSAMKHGKSVSANPEYGIYSYGGYGKRRDSGPDGPAFPSSTSKTFGVRFNNADATMKRSNQHHRRSSTAAVIEYIRRQIDGESVEKTSIAFTAKRAFLLFCVSLIHLMAPLILLTEFRCTDRVQRNLFSIRPSSTSSGISRICRPRQISHKAWTGLLW